MLNSEQYLTIFSEIENWLRRTDGADRSSSFYQLVDRAAITNPVVRRFKDHLKEYADLRNALVHERTDGHVIAEPNDRALQDFDRIRSALLKPPVVVPKFQRQVRSRDVEEAIGHAVNDMQQGSFSQLPILHEGKVIALLTSETVVRWLASEVRNDLVSLMETRIGEVLPHVEDEDHYCFLARGASLHEALCRFEEFTSRGKDLDAILVTHDGKADQTLLGILTVYDLPSILESLGLRRLAAA